MLQQHLCGGERLDVLTKLDVSITNHGIHISYIFPPSHPPSLSRGQGSMRKGQGNLANYGTAGFVWRGTSRWYSQSPMSVLLIIAFIFPICYPGRRGSGQCKDCQDNSSNYGREGFV